MNNYCFFYFLFYAFTINNCTSTESDTEDFWEQSSGLAITGVEENGTPPTVVQLLGILIRDEIDCETPSCEILYNRRYSTQDLLWENSEFRGTHELINDCIMFTLDDAFFDSSNFAKEFPEIISCTNATRGLISALGKSNTENELVKSELLEYLESLQTISIHYNYINGNLRTLIIPSSATIGTTKKVKVTFNIFDANGVISGPVIAKFVEELQIKHESSSLDIHAPFLWKQFNEKYTVPMFLRIDIWQCNIFTYSNLGTIKYLDDYPYSSDHFTHLIFWLKFGIDFKNKHPKKFLSEICEAVGNVDTYNITEVIPDHPYADQ